MAGTSQVVIRRRGSLLQELHLPSANSLVLPGVAWGRCDVLFTPAYWASQAWLREPLLSVSRVHRLGATLREEVAACVLGGYGVPSEVGLAAFQKLRSAGLLAGDTASIDTLFEALSQPLHFGSRTVRYRFAAQKSAYLSRILTEVPQDEPKHCDDLEFRNWLLTFPGIGPKTASWITRNWRGSDRVAIIDVHVYRAGTLIGLFGDHNSASTHYYNLESKYLGFAKAIGVRPSVLDALIWRQMKDYARRDRMSRSAALCSRQP